MGKALRDTNPSDVADQVAQSVGLSPTGPKQQKGQPAKPQNPSDLSDAVAQSLGLKKKDGGGEQQQPSSPSPLSPPSPDKAAEAFEQRKATPEDIEALSQTDQGKKKGWSSFSPEESALFAKAHNGTKRSDYIGSIFKEVDNFYPAGNEEQNKVRQKMKEGVLDGDQKALSTLKKSITESLEKKIAARASELERPIVGHNAFNRAVIAEDPQIKQWQQQQQHIERTFDDYGKLRLASGSDMQPWLKFESDNPSVMTSVAATHLATLMEKNGYKIDRATPNKSFDQQKMAIGLIMDNLSMDINDLISQGLPTKNKALLDEANKKIDLLNKYRQWDSRLDVDQHPDVGMDRTQRMLGDIISEKHPNKFFISPEDVHEAAKIAEDRNPGFMGKYGQFIDAASKNTDQIPHGGAFYKEFSYGLERGATGVGDDISKLWDRVTGNKEGMEAIEDFERSASMRGVTSSAEPTKIVYDKENRAYREMPNENYSPLPWNNFSRFAGESIPGLLEFVGAEQVTGGLAAGAGGMGLRVLNTVGKEVAATTNAMIGAKDLYAGYEAVKLSKGFQGAMGLIGASYITSYNANREFADANIDDTSSAGETKKTVAANFLTLANAGIFHILGASPSKAVEAAISKAVMPDVIAAFEKNSWEKLSEKTAAGLLNNSIMPRAKALVKRFGDMAGKSAKLGLASVLDEKVKDLVGVMANPDYKPSTIGDNARAFTQMAIVPLMLGLPGMVKSGLVADSYRDILHEAGLRAPQYIDNINERVESGELDSKKAAGMISMIKTMHEELGKAQLETTDDGTPLTNRQQRDIAVENWRKRAAAAMEENGQELSGEKVGKEADEKIKEIKKDSKWVPIDETATFKSIKPVAEDGQPVKTMSDIDPTKLYTWEKGGKRIGSSGASLIYHLETADIHDTEEVLGDNDQKPAPAQEAQDAEGKDQKPAEDKEKATVKEAAKFANELKEAGQIPDTYHSMITPEDATPFWKMVAQQAQNIDAEGKPLPGEPEAAEKATVSSFGRTVVDFAKDQYPKEDSQKGNSVPRGTSEEQINESGEEANRNIAAHLQASYDRLLAGGADPDDSEMVRMRERIEKLSSKPTDNGTDEQKEQSADGAEGSERGQGPGSADGQEGAGKESGQGPEVLNPTGGGDGTGEKAGPTPAGDHPVVGIRDSIMNNDRIHRGLQPLVKEFVRSWGNNWSALKRNIANGFSPRQHIEDTALRLQRGDRVVFNDYEYASLLFDRLNIQNDIARATDHLNDVMTKQGDDAQPTVSSLGELTATQDIISNLNRQLDQNEQVGRVVKSETGRALSAIQMMTNMNGQLLRWSADIASFYHGHVPERIKDFVEKIEKEYKEKAEELRKHYEEELKKAGEDAFKKAQKSKPEAKKPEPGAKKPVKLKGKELADKIRGLRPKSGGSASAQIFGLPIAIYDTAIVAIANAVEAGASIADAINEAIKGMSFGSDKDQKRFVDYMKGVEDPEYVPGKQASLIEDIRSIAQEKDSTNIVPDSVKPLRQLMTSYVQNGDAHTLDELVAKTKEAIGDYLPDADERDIRDAFSGYGVKPETEGSVKSRLKELKEQAEKVSKYQDLLEKKPGETPAEEEKRKNKARNLAEEVEGYMKQAGIHQEVPISTPEGRKALALENSKKRYTSIINGLNEQILAGERKQRNGVEPDAELSVLKAEKERLTTQLNQIEKAKLTPEEQIKQMESALNRQIASYERQIKEGINPLKPKEERPSSAQIEELRKRRKELRQEVNDMRVGIDPKSTPVQKALVKYNEMLRRQVRNMEERIKNKDYEVEEKVPVDIQRDRVSLALESRLKKLQSDYYNTKRVAEVHNQKWIQRAMSLASSLKRSFVLSRISTFGRLGGAVAWNTVFEPKEAIAGTVGYTASKVGFGKKINQIAERYGVPDSKALGTMWKAEGAGLKSVTNKQTWKDFVSDAKNGVSELGLMYGHGDQSIPKESRDTWMKIEHGLESFGRGHGAVKGISKRIEFTRSYMIRKAALERKGVDVNNEVIRQSIGAMAYQDAMRSILMEDNWLSTKYQDAIHDLQNGGFGANALALTLQEMMPIVKIPTNLVLNAGRATLGFPMAGAVIAMRGLIDIISKGKSDYGISKLSPQEADALLRNLRKGSVGMALMTAGFFAPQMFGASHYYKKGTEQPDGLEEGDVRYFGLHIPKWLADNPYLMTMKIGASLRNAFDYYTDQEGVGEPVAAARAFIGTAADALKETPLMGTPSEAIQAAEGYGGNWFWYNQVKGTLEPGIIQEIAEDTDNRDEWWKVVNGDRIKRAPQTTLEALKTGIPGMRQEVEEK